MDIESQFVRRQCPVAGEISLHVAVCGPKDAPALFFVHGFPEFWYGWIEQLKYFSKRFRCYAIDLRGFNQSSQPEALAAYRPALIVDDLRFVIGGIGAPVRAVIAHDWGGAVCWSLAAQSPELMKRFVVVNSPHAICFARALAEDEDQIRASEYMNWLRAKGSEAVLAENNFERLVAMASLATDEQLTRYRECWSRGLSGGVNYYRASPLHPDTAETPGHAKALAAALDPSAFQVNVPTQIIWGTGDAALRPVLLEGIETHVPNVKITRIEGASHWLLRERASEVNRIIDEFVH